MTPTVVMALTGFFAFSGVTGMTTGAIAKADTQPAPIYVNYTVAMTAYNAVPEQTDGDPMVTASGAYSDPDVIAARSQDLADELPYGTVIRITPSATSTPNCGYGLVDDLVGLRVIGDSMNARMHNKVDILFDPSDTVRARGHQMNPALVLGLCKDMTISIVGHVDIRHMPKNQTELRAAVGLPAQAGLGPIASK